MSTVALCRVCLASNTKMHHIANTPYQEIFEKLATKLHTADGKPETVCWVCLSALQCGRRLADTARAAHEILTQFSHSGIQLDEDTVSILDRNFVRKLSWTPIQTLSINKGHKHSPTEVEIKQEPPENYLTNKLKDETQASNQIQALNRTQASNQTQVETNNTQVETNNTQVLLTLSHTELDLAQEKQTVSQEIDTECETILNIKLEEITCDEVSEANCENDFSEIKTGKTLLDIDTSIVKREESKEDGMSENSSTLAGIKQETVEIPAEFEVALTHRLDETPTSLLKLKRSSETLLKERHSRENVRHSCPLCDNTYTHRCHMLRHIRMHNEGADAPRNFCCETCGKSFYTKSILNEHQQSHSEQKRFSCDHCPVQCSKKIDMERHISTHTGQKLYQCDTCKQKFNRKYNMLLHILTHADSKPFICQICKQTFSRKYDLNRHTNRKHICEKPHACGICDFRSVNASYLKTHIANKHLKTKAVKPYACSVCGIGCSSEKSLKFHMKKKHSGVSMKTISKKF